MAGAMGSTSVLDLLQKHLEPDEAVNFSESLDVAIKAHKKTDVQKFSKLTVDLVVKSRLPSAVFPSLWEWVFEAYGDPEHRFRALAVFSDNLHHLKFGPKSANPNVSGTLSAVAPMLPIITEGVAKAVIVADLATTEDQLTKLGVLLSWWETWACFPTSIILDSQKRLDRQMRLGPASSQPWHIPAMHGDPGTPWYDLPAANLMQHIKPDSTRPIKTRELRPMKLRAGEPDPKLLAAVESLILEAKRGYGDTVSSEVDNHAVVRIDKMGQKIYKDAKGDGIRTADTYYGWSPSFCEQMTVRKKKIRERKNRRTPSPDYPRGRDVSRGRSAHDSRSARRRRSSSYSSRSRSRSRSHSYGRVSTNQRRKHSSSRSRSRSRPRSADGTSPRSRQVIQAPHQVLDRGPAFGNSYATSQAPQLPQQASFTQHGMPVPAALVPPFRSPFNAAPPFQLPPRPPNYVGPWPPPPPPLPLGLPGAMQPIPGSVMPPGFIPPFPFPQPPTNMGFPPMGMPNMAAMPFQGNHMSFTPPPPPSMNGSVAQYGVNTQTNGQHQGRYDQDRRKNF